MTNTYATDGKCHNANHGTYGHECGKPATWLGTKSSGFVSGYCDRCKQDGDEAKYCVEWTRITNDQIYDRIIAKLNEILAKCD